MFAIYIYASEALHLAGEVAFFVAGSHDFAPVLIKDLFVFEDQRRDFVINLRGLCTPRRTPDSNDVCEPLQARCPRRASRWRWNYFVEIGNRVDDVGARIFGVSYLQRPRAASMISRARLESTTRTSRARPQYPLLPRASARTAPRRRDRRRSDRREARATPAECPFRSR